METGLDKMAGHDKMESQGASKPRIWLRVARIAVVIIISLLVGAILVKTRPKPQQKTVNKLGPLVDVIQIQKTSPNMIIEVYGTVRSGERLILTAEISGSIIEMSPDFEEGVYFPKGSFLIRIDPRNYSLRVEKLQTEIHSLQAELARVAQEKKNLQATLKIAEEELDLSKTEFDRQLTLAKRKVVSQNELDRARKIWLTTRLKTQDIQNSLQLQKFRVDLLKAQQQSVRVQLKEAKLALERTEIRAPFNCRIAKKITETGQYVMAGTPLAEIYNVGIMEVEVRIPPSEAIWLNFGTGGVMDPKGGDPVKAKIIFKTPFQELSWDGFVSRVKGQMEEQTRTLPLVVEVKNGHPSQDRPILPGMFVMVEIVGKKIDDLFLLPREAVRENSSIYVVDSGKIEVRPVEILRRSGDQIYIKKGGSQGEKVVTRFPGVLSEGMTVRVRQVPFEKETPK